MKLLRLTIENFKGIKVFEPDFDGQNAVIAGVNGSGKTTVFDAFLYLLFDKDSSGRKDFGLRPLDETNEPIKGLVLMVEALLEIDGKPRKFRKENHEDVVKDQIRGYKTLCWIDDVPKKVGEYKDTISDIIPEDTFKLLTDAHFFNEKMHWTDRRKVLLEIAGEIGAPAGFEELFEELGLTGSVEDAQKIKDREKVLGDQKKRLVKERDEINPRIDEIQRGLDAYVAPKKSEESLELNRSSIKCEIDKLDQKRTELLEAETARQATIDQLNEKKAAKLKREAELANNTDGIKKHLDEKARIEGGLERMRREVQQAEGNVIAKQQEIKNDKAELDNCTRQLVKIRDEYTASSEAPLDDSCYACGQKLPADKLKEVEAKRKSQLADITKRGNEIKADVDTVKASIAKREEELAALNDDVSNRKSAYNESLEASEERLAELQKLVDSNETTPPEKDSVWLTICEEIKKLEETIGEPISKQLSDLEAERRAKSETLEKINTALAQSDRNKKDKERIAELEAKEKELAQQIADVEKALSDIEAYKTAQSKLLEAAVNDRFKHVNFKLFNGLLNGNTEECCEATFHGVPYADCSYGQKMVMGVDIIGVLCLHYGIDCPLFIDNAESLTYQLDYDGQMIELHAKEDVTKLTFEKKGEVAHV